MSFFLVPIIGSGTRTDPLRPKYVRELGIADWSSCDFGATSILYTNGTAQQEADLSANVDVVTVPPLDNTIANGALTQVKSQLEGLNLPAQWVQVGMTYRTVLRVTVGMAQLIQRTSAILGQPVTIPGNLDKTISQFPVAVRNAIAQACDELGINRTNITGSTTLRAALADFGQQFIAGNTIALGNL